MAGDQWPGRLRLWYCRRPAHPALPRPAQPRPSDPAYIGHYGGDRRTRDAAYHQGTVWGWLIGLFASAHLRVYRDPATARSFLEPLLGQLASHGLGSLSEIFDGDPPHTPRGCIAQAWTMAEVLRVWEEMKRV